MIDPETMRVIRLQLEAKRRHSADYWKTDFDLFKEHRQECATCRNGNPIFGPFCSQGFQLKNNAINEMHGARTVGV